MAAPATFVSRTRTAARTARAALLTLIDLRAEGVRLGGATYIASYFADNPDLDINQADFIAGLNAINSINAKMEENSNEIWKALDKLAD